MALFVFCKPARNGASAKKSPATEFVNPPTGTVDTPAKARRDTHSTLGSAAAPTAPWRSAPWSPPLASRKKERRPVRP